MTIYALSTGPGISGVAIIRVSGAETEKIVNTVAEVSKASAKFDVKPYGEGNAAEKIALILKDI